MTHYAPYPDERSEFPSEDEPLPTSARRGRRRLLTVTLALVAGVMVASSFLLS